LRATVDTYSRRARLYPALLVVAPVSLLAVSLFPSAPEWWSKLSALLSASGLPFLTLQFGRQAGKWKEHELFAEWGGKPTTTLLRRRGNTNPVAVARRHEQIESILGVGLPSLQEETADPAGADAAYDAAVEALRERTRDRQKFPLVFDELCSYGFRRNLWGHRSLGIAISIAGLSGAIAALLVSLTAGWSILPLPVAVVSLIDALTLVIWVTMVTSDWVRQAAFAYAERLIASVELLASQ
jgi:hypothetical protein